MFPVYVLTFLLCAVNALQNVTLDDNNPQIIYAPPESWGTSATTPLDVGGSHKLTQDPTATAKFVFIGVAIYFFSPRWPYTVNTQITLDSGPSVLVDLVDHTRPATLDGPETVQSLVVWSATGLTNTQHTLVMSVGQGQPFAIVDTLMYTVLDASDVSSTSSIVSTSGSSTQTTTHSSPTTTLGGAAHTSGSADNAASSQTHPVPIIVGTVLGLAALSIFIIGLVFFCRRRKQRPASEVWTVTGTSNPTLPTMPGSPFGPFPGGEITGRYPNIDSWGSHPYANATLIPGAMAPATAAALAHRHSDSSGEGNPTWQGTTAQMTEKFNNRAPERYQPSILSTITETSPQPSVTPLAYSPTSQQTELRDTSMQSGHNKQPAHQITSQNYSTSVDGRWDGPNGHPYSRRPPAYI